VFLSGGVDSSVIACAARRQGPVQTFSIGFDDPRYDESKYAEEVAKHLGTEHHVFHVRPHAAEDLTKLARVFGEPFADSSALPTHYLSRETRKYVKVALSGDGGDELFGGYDRYRAMQLGGRFRMLAPFASVGRTLARGHPKSKLTRAGRLLASLSLSTALRYDAYLRIFDDTMLAALLGERELPQPEVAAIFAIEKRRYRDPVRAAAATDRAMYLPDDLLTKVDRASMLHALEVRSPFMDPDLVHFAATLTNDQLLTSGPKRLLREAFAKDLPPSVFTRPKMGFAVPIGEWFRGELRPMLRDHLFASNAFARQRFDMATVERLVEEHEQSRVDHAQRLFALLMLELWWRLQKPMP
jgi:asparagine synthase (glutamine-hydrolysing)